MWRNRPRTNESEPTVAFLQPLALILPCDDSPMENTVNSYRTVTPYLIVPDGDAELNFLKEAFGATESICHRSADNVLRHAEIQIGDSLVMLAQASEQWAALPAALYLWVEDVDGVYAKALAAGAASLSAPEDKAHGHRDAGVSDPNGITWWIGSPVK